MSTRRWRRSRLIAAACLLGAGGATLAAMAPAGATVHPSVAGGPSVAGRPSIVQKWSITLAGGRVIDSSPVPAEIGTTPVALVGTSGGYVYAVDLATGAVVRRWASPGNLPIGSTPSVNGSIFYVGVGTPAKSVGGGYLALNANGTRRWFRQLTRTPTDHVYSGVEASMAVAETQRTKTVTAGSLGQEMDSLNAATGGTMKGFPWPSTDSEFSTPAVTNLYGNGVNYIISGAAQTAGYGYHHHYAEGGHIRIIKQTGNAGYKSPIGGAVCDITPNEAVDSSPAVGPILNGKVGIIVGTGTEINGVSDEDVLYGVRPNCTVAWTHRLDGGTYSSPALVDAVGNGRLQIAEGTATSQSSGTAYLIDGANGDVLWHRTLPGEILGSITSANLGGGYQDLLVPTVRGLYILDGRTGDVVDQLAINGVALLNSPLVTDDPGGGLGITIAGYNGHGQGAIVHFEVAGAKGSWADEAGAWPMFHHDPQLTGSTLKPLS